MVFHNPPLGYEARNTKRASAASFLPRSPSPGPRLGPSHSMSVSSRVAPCRTSPASTARPKPPTGRDTVSSLRRCLLRVRITIIGCSHRGGATLARFVGADSTSGWGRLQGIPGEAGSCIQYVSVCRQRRFEDASKPPPPSCTRPRIS